MRRTRLERRRPLSSPVRFTLGWALTGPMFDYSQTWQLVINTGTTIVTFLMVFLIQNSQNRDGQAVQLKLDELIRAVEGARNDMIDLDELSDVELDRLHLEFQRLGKCDHVPVDAAVVDERPKRTQ